VCNKFRRKVVTAAHSVLPSVVNIRITKYFIFNTYTFLAIESFYCVVNLSDFSLRGYSWLTVVELTMLSVTLIVGPFLPHAFIFCHGRALTAGSG
jgi:hypothetical protein